MSERFIKRVSRLDLGCVDGRVPIAIVGKSATPGFGYSVIKREDVLTVNYPQLLGGAFAAVAMAEHQGAGFNQAFSWAGKSIRTAGLLPQIHMDDNHGCFDPEDPSFIKTILKYLHGCGFADSHFNDAARYYNEAIRRGWPIQILAGEHQERGAILNNRPNTSFDVVAANTAAQSKFNQDLWAGAKIAHWMEKISNGQISKNSAILFLVSTYSRVVVSLKGVKNAFEIQQVQ